MRYNRNGIGRDENDMSECDLFKERCSSRKWYCIVQNVGDDTLMVVWRHYERFWDTGRERELECDRPVRVLYCEPI